MECFVRVELRTPRLHLTTDDTRLTELAELARDGIHDPAIQPFGNAWTDTTPEGRARSVHAWWREHHTVWDSDDWHLPFIVAHGDAVIGVQELAAKHFRILRTVHTGSWLGQVYQNQGFGTEMRAAVLYFAFATLQAHFAETDAHTDNAASNRVSQKLGYTPNGTSRRVIRGAPMAVNHYIMPFSDWLTTHENVPVEIGCDVHALLAACCLTDPRPV